MITDLHINIWINIKATVENGEVILSKDASQIAHRPTVTLEACTMADDIHDMTEKLRRLYSGEALIPYTTYIRVYLKDYIDNDDMRDDVKYEVIKKLYAFLRENMIGEKVEDGLGSDISIADLDRNSIIYRYYTGSCNGIFVFNISSIIRGKDISMNDYDPPAYPDISFSNMSSLLTNGTPGYNIFSTIKREEFFYILFHEYEYYSYLEDGRYKFSLKPSSYKVDITEFYPPAKQILSLNRRHRNAMNRCYRAIRDREDDAYNVNPESSSYYDDFNVEEGHIARSSYKAVAKLISDYAHENPTDFMKLYNSCSDIRYAFEGRRKIMCHLAEIISKKKYLNKIV